MRQVGREGGRRAVRMTVVAGAVTKIIIVILSRFSLNLAALATAAGHHRFLLFILGCQGRRGAVGTERARHIRETARVTGVQEFFFLLFIVARRDGWGAVETERARCVRVAARTTEELKLIFLLFILGRGGSRGAAGMKRSTARAG